ncbi:unnamed protein product [Linum trigynum]|uniref:Uncharacterized protein n=1 Tax=Linum trigynum TaxID=586398 RepID=A0AAV2GQH2_9ROSI
MQKADILLGRPWQLDRRVIHDGSENSYTLKHDGKKIKLKPMSPDEVYADLKTMEERRNEGKGDRAQLWVQGRLGFNFMSLRKLQEALPELEPAAYNKPDSSRVKRVAKPAALSTTMRENRSTKSLQKVPLRLKEWK